ncbi:MAG TPA: hypothetical protein VG710_01170 [Opitutus sp.]|nr:hypothetical protein [Opitutus sp.]
MKARFLPITLFACAVVSAAAAETKSGWAATTWNGERAYAATSGAWRAIVSIDRGRLIYFGAANEDRNLLFAPPKRDTPMGWGGHRVWCGPQELWPGGWPPPEAWEHSAPANVKAEGARLELKMPDSPDGWPNITREYFWTDGALHCRVKLTGGTRDAQIIQILQVPASAEATVQAAASPKAVRGYVQVHLGRHPSPRYEFPAAPQVAADGGSLRIKFAGTVEKLGFDPQPLHARIGGTALTISRGVGEGAVVSTPDDGYMTQVYFGSSQAALIELEQLSPLWRAGDPAEFDLVISVQPAGSADD